jgi:AcrR family transcriptional regulator
MSEVAGQRGAAASTKDVRESPEIADAAKSMRADARRNYERIVAAARDVFAKYGGDASMEAVAREAGVGVGTLYRHFPRRIDLVEAVYRNDVDELVEAAERVEALDPWPALVAWLESFVRYAQSKRTLINELADAFEKDPSLRIASRERIDHAVSAVLGRAQRAGVARDDITGSDLMQLIGPMCTVASLSEDQAERLLRMIIDGLGVRGD